MNMAGGDNDEDDHAAAKVWDAASASEWTPEAWHKSPLQMQAEAQNMNHAAFEHAAMNAKKHSNPPCMPTSMRPL